MKPRIYTDTSVLGGCEDEEFREPSLRLLEAFQRGELTLVVSELTIRELETAPEGVRMVLGRVPAQHTETLALSREAEEVAAAYIADGVNRSAHARGRPAHRPRYRRSSRRARQLELQAHRELEANSRVQCGQPQEGLPSSRDSNSPRGPRR